MRRDSVSAVPLALLLVTTGTLLFGTHIGPIVGPLAALEPPGSELQLERGRMDEVFRQITAGARA